MRDLSGIKFDKTRVTLDDTHFKDCEITNCEFVYSGGPYECTNTTIKNCRFVLRGPAAYTVSLLDQFGLIDPTQPKWKAVVLETPPGEETVH